MNIFIPMHVKRLTWKCGNNLCEELFSRLDDGRLSPATVPLGAAAHRDLDDSHEHDSPSFTPSSTTWMPLMLLATHTLREQPRQW
jgi:hypothetical protein